MGRTQGRQKTRCPECLAPIWLKDSPEAWDPVTCPECHTSLEVISTHPLTLDYMSVEEGVSDWEDEEEYDN